MDLEIKGFTETSFLDWDGKIVSVVYLPECGFRCPFCHNSVLVEDSGSLKNVPFEKIEEFLTGHRDFIDGVCVTGGEPCLHKNKGLFEFLRKIKELGFQTKLDTNGADPDCVKSLIDQKLVQYVAMDIKAPLNEKYKILSGSHIHLDKIKESIKIIMESGISYEFRTTVVPDLLNPKDIEEIAKYIQGAQKYAIQQFVQKNTWDPALREKKPYTKEEFLEMAKRCKHHVPNTTVRGV